MSVQDWLTLVACAGHLGLALLAILRGSRSRLTVPLAILCMDFFTISAAHLAHRRSPDDLGWTVMDTTGASLLPPIALHFMLVFVGRRRQLQWLLTTYHVAGGALAFTCILSGFVDVLHNFPRSDTWVYLLMVLGVPLLVLIPVLLVQHLRRATSILERGRTYLVLATFTIGAIGCGTELFAHFKVDIPPLAHIGFLLCTSLLATVALRFGLFERRVSALLLFNSVLIGGLQVLGYLAVFRFFKGGAMLILGTITVSIGLLPAIRELAKAWSTQRNRTDYLATLGRFSAQMAHDLKNPLAAVKGAAQYLQVEGARSGWSTDQREYVDLIIAEVDRLSRVVGDYQRIGRAEAALAPLQLNDLIRSVVASQSLIAPAGVTLRAELDEAVPSCHADHDLVVRALENLVRNAFDALSDGGTVTLRSSRTATDPLSVVVSVVDTGCGMNARVREKAFDDFYTTKAHGSGLGLAFVKRIAEAHGGDVSLLSEEGRGTTVQLRLRAVGV